MHFAALSYFSETIPPTKDRCPFSGVFLYPILLSDPFQVEPKDLMDMK